MTAVYVSPWREPWSWLSPCTLSPPEVLWVYSNGGPTESSAPVETPTVPGNAGSSSTGAPAAPGAAFLPELISRMASPARDPPVAARRGHSGQTHICRGLRYSRAAPWAECPPRPGGRAPNSQGIAPGGAGMGGSPAHQPWPQTQPEAKLCLACSLLPAQLCPDGRGQPTEAAARSLLFRQGPSTLGNVTGFPGRAARGGHQSDRR